MKKHGDIKKRSHSGPTRPHWKGHGFGLMCGMRRRASVHVWKGCAQWLTFSVRSGTQLELGEWLGERIYERNKKPNYTPQQRANTYCLLWVWVVGDLKEEWKEVNTWGNRAEVGSSGTGKRVRIGICRGK